MRNLAGIWTNVTTDLCALELMQAGIPCQNKKAGKGEVRSKVKGILVFGGGQVVQFRRAWTYWVVELSRPLERRYARQMNRNWKHIIRVDGYAGGTDPGMGVFTYHVDTQEGLNHLASFLKQRYGVYRKRSSVAISNAAQFEFNALMRLAEYCWTINQYSWAKDITQDILSSACLIALKEDPSYEQKCLEFYVTCLDRLHLRHVRCWGANANVAKEKYSRDENADEQLVLLSERYGALRRLKESALIQGGGHFSEADERRWNWRLGRTHQRMKKWAALVLSRRTFWHEELMKTLEWWFRETESPESKHYPFAYMHLTTAAALEMLNTPATTDDKRQEVILSMERKLSANLRHPAKEAYETGKLDAIIEEERKHAERHFEKATDEHKGYLRRYIQLYQNVLA